MYITPSPIPQVDGGTDEGLISHVNVDYHGPVTTSQVGQGDRGFNDQETVFIDHGNKDIEMVPKCYECQMPVSTEDKIRCCFVCKCMVCMSCLQMNRHQFHQRYLRALATLQDYLSKGQYEESDDDG